MVDVFNKSDSCVDSSARLRIHLSPPTRVYVVDCEVVCRLRALFNPTKRLSEDGKDLTRVCIIDHESGIVVYVRQACQTTRIRHKLPHQVSLSLSSRRTHTTDYLDGQASPRHLSLWPQRPSLNFSPSSYPEVAPHPSLSVTPPESNLKVLQICHLLCALTPSHPPPPPRSITQTRTHMALQ